MGAVTQQHSLDTFVRASRPSVTFEQATILRLQADEAVAFVYFSRAFPVGASIISATLTLRTYALGAGTRSLTVRRSAERPHLSRLTWNNAPAGITGPGEPKTVTKSGELPGATEWVFDVTSHMQAVAEGAAWSGWRVETDSTSEIRLYGVDSGGPYVPTLTVVWSDAPDAPTQLVPAGGRVVSEPSPVLRWDYTDVSGDTEMSAYELEVASSESMASPWSSGVVLSSTPQADLSGTTYPGAVAGSPVWWRVRVRDGAGLWSAWSDPAEFSYLGKGVLSLVSPAPGGTVASPSPLTDASPPIQWSLTGATQASYRVRVYLNTLPKTPLWDTGRVTASTTTVSVPKGVLKWDDRRYRVRVDVWDTVDRVSTPGATAAYTAESIALLDWDATLPGTDAVAARPLDPWPHVELTWERSQAADAWTIVRNGEVLDTVDHADVVHADGSLRWVDRGAPPRTELRYTVRPRVNGHTAWGNPTALAYSDPVGIWLVTDTDEVCLIGDDEGTWGMGEHQAIHEPIRGDRVVQVRQGMRGYEGSLSGLLMSDVRGMDGITAREWRDAFLRIKRDGRARLIASSLAFPVLLAEMVAAPTPHVEERYNASFSFWQADRFAWDDLP